MSTARFVHAHEEAAVERGELDPAMATMVVQLDPLPPLTTRARRRAIAAHEEARRAETAETQIALPPVVGGQGRSGCDLECAARLIAGALVVAAIVAILWMAS